MDCHPVEYSLTVSSPCKGSYWLSYRPIVKVELVTPKFTTRYSTLRIPVPMDVAQQEHEAAGRRSVEQLEGVESDAPAYQENMV